LCNPEALLHDDDRGDYHPTLTLGQRWLWDCYEQDILAVMEIADGTPVDVLHLGDIAQGIRFMDGISQSRFADQLAIAMANADPWRCWPNLHSMTIISGTSVHEGGEGSAGELVASLWGASFANHELLSIAGVDFDVAHSGPSTGIYEWTSGNVARHHLRNRLLRDTPPARVYLRAHRHDYIRETLYVPVTADIIVLPSYQLPGAYVRDRMQSPSAAICGMVALEVDDGRLGDVWPLMHRVDLRKRVTL
jgi:hypothetical protein